MSFYSFNYNLFVWSALSGGQRCKCTSISCNVRQQKRQTPGFSCASCCVQLAVPSAGPSTTVTNHLQTRCHQRLCFVATSVSQLSAALTTYSYTCSVGSWALQIWRRYTNYLRPTHLRATLNKPNIRDIPWPRSVVSFRLSCIAHPLYVYVFVVFGFSILPPLFAAFCKGAGMRAYVCSDNTHMATVIYFSFFCCVFFY